MKRTVIVLAILLLSALGASAQRKYTFETSAYYQGSKPIQSEIEMYCPFIGISAGAVLEPFYPWPAYLELGIGAAMDGALKNGVDYYRLDGLINLMILWEPGPQFSIGPYVGLNGDIDFKVSMDSEHGTFFNWGYQAGVSIRPGNFFINAGYHRDFKPFLDYGLTFRGIRVTLGFCF